MLRSKCLVSMSTALPTSSNQLSDNSGDSSQAGDNDANGDGADEEADSNDISISASADDVTPRGCTSDNVARCLMGLVMAIAALALVIYFIVLMVYLYLQQEPNSARNLGASDSSKIKNTSRTKPVNK